MRYVLKGQLTLWIVGTLSSAHFSVPLCPAGLSPLVERRVPPRWAGGSRLSPLVEGRVPPRWAGGHKRPSPLVEGRVPPRWVGGSMGSGRGACVDPPLIVGTL